MADRETRTAIIIDANGKVAVAEFDAVTGAMLRSVSASDLFKKKTTEGGDSAAAAERKWRSYGKAIGTAVVAGFGLATTVTGLYIKNTIEAERVQAQLGARIRDTSMIAGRSLAQLNAQAERLQKTTIFDDETIGDAQAVLLTFKRIQGEGFDRTIELATDLATVMKSDVTSATKLLGKALEDPTRGMTALTRAGVTFTKAERDRIKAMVEAGRLTEAQRIILDRLDSTMGSAADTARDTLGGAFTALKNSAENLLEGDAGSGGITGIREGVEDLIDTLNDPSVKTGVDATVEGLLRIASAAVRIVAELGNAGSALIEFFSDNENKSTISLENRRVDLERQQDALGRVGNIFGAVPGGAAFSRLLTGQDKGRIQSELDEIDRLLRDRYRGAAPTLDPSNDPALFIPENKDNPLLQRDPPEVDKAAQRKREREIEELRRWRNELELAEAELQGPLKLAEVEHRQRIEELTERLNRHNITQAEFERAKRVSEETLRRSTEAYEREADVVRQVIDEYTREAPLIGLTGREYQIQEATIKAATKAREQHLATQSRAADLTAQEVAQIREAIGAQYDHQQMVERSAAAAQEYQDSWMNAVDSVSHALGDFVTRGIRSFSDFGDALKEIGRRFLSDLVSQFARAELFQSSGGFSGAGQSGGFWNWLGGMFGGSGGGSAGGGGGFWNAVGSMFGFGGGASSSGRGFNAAAQAQTAGYALMPNGTVLVPGSGGGAGGINLNGLSTKLLTGEFAGGMPYASAALGAYGLYYGATQRGNGGFSSAAAGLSYGALGVGVGGAIAGGLGALGTAAGVGGMAAGATAGATSAMAALGGAAWIPVVGWILAALAAIDMISGGKMFGTKFKPTGSMAQIDMGPDGISGFQQIQEVRNRSLFRGREWRTRNQDFDGAAKEAIDELFNSLKTAIGDAARQLGVEAPDLLVARFNQHFDTKGNLTTQYGFISGRRYDEDQETFLKRLSLENLLNVAKQVGSANEIDPLAEPYRKSVDTLEEFTTLIMAVQGDIKGAKNLWSQSGQGVLTNIVKLVEQLGRGEEKLIETYTRLNQGAMAYGEMIAGVDQQLLTSGLNEYQRAQLDIEMQYRQQIKQANDLAKAFGLSGARAEDLAKIEQLRALNMANLQKQMEKQRDAVLNNLALSELSPLTDKQKLGDAMAQLKAAVSAGDVQGANSLSQTVLGLGRNLYASGKDYNALYGQVTGMLQGMSVPGIDDTNMGDLAEILLDLPQQIAGALWSLLYDQSAPTTPPPATNPGTGTPRVPRGGAGGGGDIDGDGRCVMWDQVLEDGTRAIDVRVGQLHLCHTPELGWHMAPVEWVGTPVMQRCVMLVRKDGSTWCGSRSTPFNLPDAPADLAEGWYALAPDMKGHQVYGSAGILHDVIAILDLGEQLVVPISFGGRSFGAGSVGHDPTWSHNMMKADTLASIDRRLGQLVDQGNTALTAAQRAALRAQNV